MGTRGIVGVVIDGEIKVAYNHYDSYPSALGINTLTFARTMPEDMRAQARRLTAVDEDVPPTAEQIEQLQQYADRGVSTGELTDWYVLLRNTQGDLGKILKAGFYVSATDFARDSLFCEYGYVLDLDTLTFEAYRGFVRAPHTQGQFAALGALPLREWQIEAGKTEPEYWPIRLVGTWPLNDLPDDETFLSELDDSEDED